MGKIVLKNVRASYVNLWEPKSVNGSEPKYGLQVLLPKDHPQVAEIKKLVAEAAQSKFPGKVKDGQVSKTLKLPLRDGDEERDEADYAGCYFFNASAKRRPCVVDKAKTPLTKEDGVIYSGCYVNLSLSVYPFDAQAQKGVAVGLNAVQFKADGPRLDGASDGSEFDDESGDEEYGHGADLI